MLAHNIIGNWCKRKTYDNTLRMQQIFAKVLSTRCTIPCNAMNDVIRHLALTEKRFTPTILYVDFQRRLRECV